MRWSTFAALSGCAARAYPVITPVNECASGESPVSAMVFNTSSAFCASPACARVEMTILNEMASGEGSFSPRIIAVSIDTASCRLPRSQCALIAVLHATRSSRMPSLSIRAIHTCTPCASPFRARAASTLLYSAGVALSLSFSHASSISVAAVATGHPVSIFAVNPMFSIRVLTRSACANTCRAAGKSPAFMKAAILASELSCVASLGSTTS
mmetsp:Transcript_2622/g.6525  ORF Transcript_2622/g.6525 Transcript_2622/m.6525 type:complete len:212 (+) Transcript_2622:1475-2110(+)